MKLYLMRHGQAAATPQEQEQTLTIDGQADIKKLAEHLGQQAVRVDRIFHSGKKRTLQTARIIANEIAPAITLQLHAHIKPNDNPSHILSEIPHWQKDTLIVSHLPFIPSLLEQLVDDATAVFSIKFEPGTVICLIQENSSWQIEWVITP